MNQAEEEELKEQTDDFSDQDEPETGNYNTENITSDLIDVGTDIIGSGAVEVLENTVEKAIDVVGEVISGLLDI